MTLSSDVGNLAPGHRLEHGGKLYEFKHLGLLQLAEFERENYRLRREALREYRSDYTPESYEKRLDELRARYERHEFSIQADPEFMKSMDGLALAMRIMLGVPDAEVNDLVREKPTEVLKLFTLVLEESFRGPGGMDPNPTGGSPSPPGSSS